MEHDQQNPNNPSQKQQNSNPATSPSSSTAPKGATATRRGGGALGRLLERPLFWVLFISAAMALPLYRSFVQPKVELPPVLSQLPDFDLVNQNGDKTTLGSFAGSTLVVNFIFTSCPGVCPMLTAQMAKIQSSIVGLSPAIKLLTISVDPKTDTPEVMKAYGERFKAKFKTWTFLTGSFENIKPLVTDGFKLALEQGASLKEISHGEHFVIVDQIGRIRAYKHARNSNEINDIIKTIALVANSNPLLLPNPAAR